MTARRQKPEPKAVHGTAGELLEAKAPPTLGPVRAREAMALRPPEPYEPGNKAAVTHGAYSADLVEKTAEEIWAGMEQQLRQMPGFHSADEIFVDEMREIVSTLVLIRKFRHENGPLDSDGTPRPVVWYEDKLGRRLVDLGKAMGLGTSERAKVFGAFMSAGRAHLEALAAQQRIRDSLKRKRGTK